MASQEIQTIVDFVEGRLSAKEFEQDLYTNPAFEEVLDNDPHLPVNTYVGSSVYLYVIRQNFNSLGGILDVHGALCQFLERHGLLYSPTRQYQELHDLLLSAQPKWLSLDVDYIQREILPDAGDRTGEALKQWLQERLLQMFKYFHKPPEWVQNPEWPILNGKPLVFVGQINGPVTRTTSKDDLAFYLFLDENTGQTEVIKQVS